MNPRPYFVVVIAFGVLSLAAAGCGTGGPRPPVDLTEGQMAGWQAYTRLDCASCHGVQRQGKRSGPALTGLSELWNQDDLVVYLKDPETGADITTWEIQRI